MLRMTRRIGAARRAGGGAEPVRLDRAVIDGMSTSAAAARPARELPTRLVEITKDGLTADQIEQYLRTLDPPVIARIQDDRVVLDLRTVSAAEEPLLANTVTGHGLVTQGDQRCSA
jgi:L-seryl-tRNA(Ser) seleniumtransferase